MHLASQIHNTTGTPSNLRMLFYIGCPRVGFGAGARPIAQHRPRREARASDAASRGASGLARCGPSLRPQNE
eukprot:4365070-Pyramimonas_sp.AAC.1